MRLSCPPFWESKCTQRYRLPKMAKMVDVHCGEVCSTSCRESMDPSRNHSYGRGSASNFEMMHFGYDASKQMGEAKAKGTVSKEGYTSHVALAGNMFLLLVSCAKQHWFPQLEIFSIWKKSDKILSFWNFYDWYLIFLSLLCSVRPVYACGFRIQCMWHTPWE